MICTVRFSQRVRRSGASPIAYLMEQGVANPQILSLAAGLVDQESLPVGCVNRAVEVILGEAPWGRAALQYGTTNGDRALRELLVEHLARLDGVKPSDMDLDPDRLVVGTGAQQLLYLAAEILLDPGDIVLLGVPAYFVYMGALEGLGARIVPIDTDGDGLIPEAVHSTLARLDAEKQLERVKLIYDVSYFNNPTGLSLSQERRLRLLELVERWQTRQRIFVIEDAAYRELRYEGEALASLLKLDVARRTVLYAGTFSKSFSPGLKTGYLVGPREVVDRLVIQKGHHDFGSANFVQQVLARVLRSGEYDRHVSEIRERYRAKRDAMLATLAEELGGFDEQVTWTQPVGGLYVWVRLPTWLATGPGSEFSQRCKTEAVLVVPGEYCYPSDMAEIPRHYVRLSFAAQPIERIREGVRRFAAVVQTLMRRH